MSKYKTIQTDSHLLLVRNTETCKRDIPCYNLVYDKIYKIDSIEELNSIKKKTSCHTVIAVSPKFEDLPEFETLPTDKKYTINYHKNGDGIIRIYNQDGFVFCMYPYHLTTEAELHLQRLNSTSIIDTDVEKLAKDYANKIKKQTDYNEELIHLEYAVKYGYNQAKQEKMFSLEQMCGAMMRLSNWIFKNKDSQLNGVNTLEKIDEIVENISKSKQYQFIPDMECIQCTKSVDIHTHYPTPIIINNKIQGKWEIINISEN